MPDKILVVDDNPITRKMLRLGLAADGFEVNAIGLASEVDEALRTCPPDLVLLDLVLPDGRGFDILTKIRATLTAEQPPVLALTGLADEERILRAGFTDHLLKPIEPAQVSALIRLHLQAARASRQAPSHVPVDVEEHDTTVCKHAEPTLSARVITRPDLPRTIRRRLIAQQRENPGPHVSHAARIWKAMPVVLNRVCDPPEAPRDIAQILDEVLAGLLDASGFALGLVYTHDGKRFELRSQLGFSPSSHRDVSNFFGNTDVLQRAIDDQDATAFDHDSASQTAQELLARAQVGSMLIAPLIRRGRRVGVIVLASPNPAVPPDWLELARAARWPIAQASMRTGAAGRLVDSGHSRFRQITESLPDGLVVADANQTIIYANAAAERILGCAAADLVGQPVSAHLSVEPGDTEPPTVARSRTADQHVIDVVAQPVASDGLTLYMLRDLTERLELPALARARIRIR